MPSRVQFNERILVERERLERVREELRALHDNGLTGLDTCARLTSLVDEVVLRLFDAAIDDSGRQDADKLRARVCLVAHGGYGRRHLAPFSDVDIMVLYSGKEDAQVAKLAKHFMQDMFDVGLDLGHSVRTPEQAWRLAKSDVRILTSLVESRYLTGDEPLYQRFHSGFAQLAQKQFSRFYSAIRQTRRDERRQFGDTVYLLEPNVKRSRGSLRDLHLLRWMAFGKFSVADPEELHRRNALSKEDLRRLTNAREFLMRLRNELHFHANQARDVLHRSEQLRVAERFGYAGREGVLPVEEFMSEYFRHTSNIRYLVSRFVESVRPRPTLPDVFSPIFSHRIEGDYVVGRAEISATAQGVAKLKGDLDEVLRLADLANLYDKRIAHSSWVAIHRASPRYSDDVSPRVAQRFLSLMGQPPRLGELLRRLHELHVLEKIAPAFRHARCLLQFNNYHKYTVDEHCLRAVEAATELVEDPSPLGQAYREIKQKHILHLALLLHDLGKGFPEDHSIVGRRIATETAQRLRMPARETEELIFLVENHLVMSHLAFRRDTSDERIVLRFAQDVGSPELLRMLYALTCADLAAVGPGVLNSWKTEVLTDLYARTMRHLADDSPLEELESLEAIRSRVKAELPEGERFEDNKEKLASLPDSLLRGVAPERIAETLARLKQLGETQVVVVGQYLAKSHATQYLVGGRLAASQGMFYKAAGALTAQRLAILSADLNAMPDGLVIGSFTVEDSDFAAHPPEERIDGVCRSVSAALQMDRPPTFKQIWGEKDANPLGDTPTKVLIDNTTSDEYTIVDVFTFDRRGLLYAIARELDRLGLVIGAAKIGTSLDQVVDVFYVTDTAGQKILDPERLESIRRQLLETIMGPDGLSPES